MSKNPTGVKIDISLANSLLFLAKFLLLRYQMSLLVIAGKVWWMNQE
jgi:hypothetical protein